MVLGKFKIECPQCKGKKMFIATDDNHEDDITCGKCGCISTLDTSDDSSFDYFTIIEEY